MVMLPPLVFGFRPLLLGFGATMGNMASDASLLYQFNDILLYVAIVLSKIQAVFFTFHDLELQSWWNVGSLL